MSQPVRAVRPSPSYREVKEIEEKLKGAASISYLDLITCPRNRLPKHINKLRLQVSLTFVMFKFLLPIQKDSVKLTNFESYYFAIERPWVQFPLILGPEFSIGYLEPHVHGDYFRA